MHVHTHIYKCQSLFFFYKCKSLNWILTTVNSNSHYFDIYSMYYHTPHESVRWLKTLNAKMDSKFSEIPPGVTREWVASFSTFLMERNIIWPFSLVFCVRANICKLREIKWHDKGMQLISGKIRLLTLICLIPKSGLLQSTARVAVGNPTLDSLDFWWW